MKVNSRNIAWLLVLTIVVGIIVVLLFYTGYLRFNYPSHVEYSIMGIDVSHHQKEIDWEKVGQQGITFVFMKATEGGDFKDKRFSENWKGAKRNQMDVGAYHFFTFCKSGQEQANNFMEIVPYYGNSLPPVIDLEYGGNCKLSKTKEEVLKEIGVMDSLLFHYYRKRPIFYVTDEFYEDFLINQFPENPIWFRAIYGHPKVPDKRKWHFWQYSNRGHLDGISTYVDLNVFNGDVAAYEEFKAE